MPDEFPRPLSSREIEVTRWLIRNGDATHDDKSKYLEQLERATVVRKCACGCASVDFAIDGRTSAVKELTMVGDFICAGGTHGIFAFSKGGLLAGIDIYTLSSDQPAAELPEPAGFISIETDNKT